MTSFVQMVLIVTIIHIWHESFMIAPCTKALVFLLRLKDNTVVLGIAEMIRWGRIKHTFPDKDLEASRWRDIKL